MECPYCQSAMITERPETTSRGSHRFRCRACKRGFHERTGSVFNRVHYPPDGICLVVLWRVRYKLSLRHLAERFLERGVSFTHEAMREWETKLAPVLSDTLRKHRRGKGGRSWYCDETSLKSKGRGVSLYRAIDRDGNLVDVLLSERHDQAAAEAFFRSARTVTDRVPDRVTTDGHGAYPGAIKKELGEGVTHRTNRYVKNHLGQDHRGIKQRTHSMGASRVSYRRSGAVGSLTRCAMSFAHDPGDTKRSHELGNEPCIWAGCEFSGRR